MEVVSVLQKLAKLIQMIWGKLRIREVGRLGGGEVGR